MSCLTCLSPCATCTAPSRCRSCLKGWFLSPSTLRCVTSCPAGSLAVASNNNCDKCESSCRTCLGWVGNCTSCSSGFLSLNGQCVAACPNGTVSYFKDMSCLACVAPCATCFQTPQMCSSCLSGYILHNSLSLCLTLDECSNRTGSYIAAKSTSTTTSTSTSTTTSIKVCSLCPPTCLTCTQPHSCQSCASGYYFHFNSTLTVGSCSKYCPPGYYSFPPNSTCLACNPLCSTCLHTSNYCISCPVPAQLTPNHECVPACPSPNQLYPTC